jgi:GNAT superfamily N-acetyltransferase
LLRGGRAGCRRPRTCECGRGAGRGRYRVRIFWRRQLAVVEESSRRTRAGRALVEHAIALLGGEGARFLLAELPDDPRALHGARAFLESASFREESRVDDFYRVGVALSFMRRELDAR